MARRVRRGFIVAKIKPGSEEKVAEMFAESDRDGELPGIMAGVTHRSLSVLGDVYIHYVEMEEDLAREVVEQVGDTASKRDQPQARRAHHSLQPRDLALAQGRDRARVFYTWDAEAE